MGRDSLTRMCGKSEKKCAVSNRVRSSGSWILGDVFSRTRLQGRARVLENAALWGLRDPTKTPGRGDCRELLFEMDLRTRWSGGLVGLHGLRSESCGKHIFAEVSTLAL